MSLDRELTLWMTELDLAPGVQAAGALLDPHQLWVSSSAETLASRFAEHLQQKKLDRGEVVAALLAAPAISAVETETLSLEFPAGRRRGGLRSLRYEVALAELRPDLWLGVVPVLGYTVTAPDREAARRALRDRVSAGLVFEKRMDDPRALLISQVGTGLRARAVPLQLSARTASELAALRARKEPRLPGVARRRTPGRPPSFELGPELERLRTAASGQATRGVIVVGPHGVGKSALLDELLWQTGGEVEGGPVWEVAPGQLLLDLMADGDGWQQALSLCIAELRACRGWLRVTRLAELFEVGRYEGNPSSLAELLRAPLQRGDLRLLSEATPTEIAHIEARYPGWLDGLARVTVDVPGDRLPRIAAAWARSRGLGAEPGAIDELVRLQRRFLPHAGYPGRTLRFLAADVEARHGPLTRERVLSRFCDETGLLRALIDPRAPLSLDELRGWFRARVYGQDEAMEALVELIGAMKADVARHGKPLASLLLVGPTGVGKTETARALAERLFGSRDRMIRFDMSEYASPIAVSRLVGGEEGGEGALTGAVRRQPFAVLLFDEVEKAHPAFLDLLLQVLGEGRLTDDAGRVADFNATVVLLTSNVGGAESRRAPSGFQGEDLARRMSDHYSRAVRQWLRPELMNRLDRVLSYAPLSAAAARRVLERELAALRRRPGLEGVELRLDEASVDWLARRGADPAWGGRAMLRAIEDELTAPLATELARHRKAAGLRVEVGLGGGGAHGEALIVRAAPGPTAGARPDAPFDDALMLHRSMSQLLTSRGFATLDGRAHRAARTARGDEVPAEVALRDSVLSLERDGLGLLLDAGVQAMGAGEPATPGDRHAALADRLLSRLRALHHLLRPAESCCVLGVYGRDLALLRAHRDHLLALCARLELTAAEGVLYPVKDSLTLVEPANARPPDGASDVVGYELFVHGPAAWVALAPEARLIESTSRGAAPVRLRVVCVETPERGQGHAPATLLDRARQAARRPRDLLRQQLYEGRATRLITDGALTDLDERGKVERQLPGPWSPAIIEARVRGLRDALLARMD